jgi:hypothetical protein
LDTPVFDASRPLTLNLRGPEGVKAINLRFPTDDEWIERQRRRKAIVKDLGRGVSETTVVNGEEVDAALVAKLRMEPEPEIDPFEAMKIMEQLSQADVDDVLTEGDTFRVVLRVLGVTTAHVLKIPSQKDAVEHQRSFARVLGLPYGRQELRINIAPTGALYKKLLVSAEGYEGPVPIVHQAVAVKAAIDALNNAFAEDRDANF